MLVLRAEAKTLINVPPTHSSATNHKDNQDKSRDNLEDIFIAVPALCYRLVTDANCCWTGS